MFKTLVHILKQNVDIQFVHLRYYVITKKGEATKKWNLAYSGTE